MNEGREPKWEKPFCWKCMRHTPYKKEYRTTENHSRADSVREYTACKICGSKGMHIPANFDNHYLFGMYPRRYPLQIGCLLLLPLVCMCPFILGLFYADTDRGVLYGVLISIFVFFIAMYGGSRLWCEYKYRAWKEWAKMRGWKEPNKSERIKRGAKKR